MNTTGLDAFLAIGFFIAILIFAFFRASLDFDISF